MRTRDSIFQFVVILIMVTASSCDSGSAPVLKDHSNLSAEVQDGREKHANIEFDEDFVDLASIKHGEVVAYTYQFHNSGNIPLVITDVIAGCGCTKTKLSKEVFYPNEKGTLEVVFDSRGWHGSQFKSVTIVSNALTQKRSVTLKVNVV